MSRPMSIALMLAGIVGSGSVLAATPVVVNEVEVNEPIASAQKVEADSGNLSISAVLGHTTGTVINDTDYYTFFGMEGDVVTVDIDGAIGGARSFDSYIAIFGPGPDYKVLRANDDSLTIDEGSLSKYDSMIENFSLPAAGFYTVGVTSFRRQFRDGGVLTTGSIGNGDYSLVITGVSPPVQQISIDIKPGSGDVAPINPKSKGKVPVALLSSTKFDALSADVTSLTFGATGDEKSLSKCGESGEDVNGDGRLDLVCHFENQLTGFEKGDLEGIVHGRTKWGSRFEGRGFLKVLAEKRER